MADGKDVKVVNQAIYLRGLFVQRYSGIEFALSELIMRAGQLPIYQNLGALPWRFDKKLHRLQQLIESEGPIQQYAIDLTKALGDFTNFEERRHFLVHGIMALVKEAEDTTTVGFRMYDHRRIVARDGDRPSVAEGLKPQPPFEGAAHRRGAATFRGIEWGNEGQVGLPVHYEGLAEASSV